MMHEGPSVLGCPACRLAVAALISWAVLLVVVTVTLVAMS